GGGTLFPAGVTTVTYTATDAAGLTATCSFTVTVSPDTQPPTISGCPANIGPLAMDAGQCGAVATWVAPTVNDNCLGATIAQTAGPASGSLFPAGVTTVTYTATDAAGVTATCSFSVTGSPDTQPPPVRGCPANHGPLAPDAGPCGAGTAERGVRFRAMAIAWARRSRRRLGQRAGACSRRA